MVVKIVWCPHHHICCHYLCDISANSTHFNQCNTALFGIYSFWVISFSLCILLFPELKWSIVKKDIIKFWFMLELTNISYTYMYLRKLNLWNTIFELNPEHSLAIPVDFFLWCWNIVNLFYALKCFCIINNPHNY